MKGFWKCFRVGGRVWVCYGVKKGLGNVSGGGYFSVLGGPKLENGGPEIDFGVMSTSAGFEFGVMSKSGSATCRKWRNSSFWRNVDIAKMSVFGVKK